LIIAVAHRWDGSAAGIETTIVSDLVRKSVNPTSERKKTRVIRPFLIIAAWHVIRFPRRDADGGNRDRRESSTARPSAANQLRRRVSSAGSRREDWCAPDALRASPSLRAVCRAVASLVAASPFSRPLVTLFLI